MPPLFLIAYTVPVLVTHSLMSEQRAFHRSCTEAVFEPRNIWIDYPVSSHSSNELSVGCYDIQ